MTRSHAGWGHVINFLKSYSRDNGQPPVKWPGAKGMADALYFDDSKRAHYRNTYL
jgi:hypothetical protein